MAEKLFYSIKEVAERIGVSEPTLRYWEKEFQEISPRKTASGIRQYTVKDIEIIESIHFLLKDQGLSISDARKHLADDRRGVDSKVELRNRLTKLRDQLQELRDELDN